MGSEMCIRDSFYTRLKTVTARWPSGIKEGAVFNFSAGSEVQ